MNNNEPRNFGKISVENALITSRNFGGDKEQGRYAKPGRRSFTLIIEDPGMAEYLLSNGANLGYREPSKEGESPRWYLKILLNYANGRAPRIYIYEDDRETLITEDTVSILDSADIVNVDLVFRMYQPRDPSRQWTTKDGRIGASAYLDVMYVTIDVDPFASKYRSRHVSSDADIPEADPFD